MFIVFIAAMLVLVVVVVLVLFGKKAGKGDAGIEIKNKDEAKMIKTALHKLERNPDNVPALSDLSNIYFENSLYEKALPMYKNLVRISPLHPEIDLPVSLLRAGICLVKSEEYEEAVKYLVQANSKDSATFDVNYNLGLCYTKLKDLEKAELFLKKALIVEPASEFCQMDLARTLYARHHYKEAVQFLKKLLVTQPDNKEARFMYADCMAEEGQGEKVLKIFDLLRPDPVYGARSCLRSGIYHFNQGDKRTAIEDFTIGLKLKNTPQDEQLELKYRLAQCYFETNRFQDGLALLQEIRQVNPQYKDINQMISRYSELSQNSNLQVYLSGSVGEFISLCQKIVAGWGNNSFVKILDASAGPVFTDVISEIDMPGQAKIECVFRFFRTTGSTGELFVREFHDSLQDRKASRGVCITAGTFTEDARHYAEGRPVDLVERDRLNKILKFIV